MFKSLWLASLLVTTVLGGAALADGSAQFLRDHETIDVAPNTQIQIVDRKGQRYATVRQYFETIRVEANRENVKHSEVRTPYLAAVVRGAIFAVTTTAKSSAVAVSRGEVGVSSGNGAHSDVAVGQTATVAQDHGVSIGQASAAASSSRPGGH